MRGNPSGLKHPFDFTKTVQGEVAINKNTLSHNGLPCNLFIKLWLFCTRYYIPGAGFIFLQSVFVPPAPLVVRYHCIYCCSSRPGLPEYHHVVLLPDS